MSESLEERVGALALNLFSILKARHVLRVT
jgi:hypothetical protein